jgi:hypothetical protein
MSFYDDDAIYSDADIEQAELEQMGRENDWMHRKMESLRDSDPMAAALACPHGGGYPLASLAATNYEDPRAGEPEGWRCCDCGSVLATNRFDFDYPCEVPILIPCDWRKA